MPSSATESKIRQRPELRQTPLGPVEYMGFGDGPVIIALHGAMGGCDQSAILADTVLDGTFRVLAVSRPGYLGTPLSSRSTPMQQADLVATLLDSLGVERAGVIAISGGGPCAISFAHQHPDRCKGVVLISTVSGKNQVSIPFRFTLIKLLAHVTWVVQFMRKRALSDLERTLARSITKPHLRRSLMADQETLALYHALIASTFDRMAERIAGTNNDIQLTQTTEYPLEEIRIPVLVVHGRDDRLVRFEQHAQGLANRIPRARLVALEEGEHAAIFTHRPLVQREIVQFLQLQGC